MTATDLPAPPPQAQPPEADVQFDVGATEDSLERMTELFARHGDLYRVYAPGRKSYTWVINHPRGCEAGAGQQSPQLHQGHGPGPGEDPAGQRPHDQ
ncbi:MAG: hypothetical protein WDM77_13520 [Steroidobacteraceae bacterium]